MAQRGPAWAMRALEGHSGCSRRQGQSWACFGDAQYGQSVNSGSREKQAKASKNNRKDAMMSHQEVVAALASCRGPRTEQNKRRTLWPRGQ